MKTMAQGTNERLESVFQRTDMALLVLRVMIGVVFIAHGTQKLFGTFGGPGLDAVANAMAKYGLQPGMFFAVLGGVLELSGGLLLLLGLLTPLAALIISGVMVMAIAVSTGQNGFIPLGRMGYEYNLVLISIALALLIAGPGRLSLDHQLGVHQYVADHTRRLRATRM